MEREHLLLGFAREFTHFFAIILWIGAALAFVAEHFDPGQGMASLGVSIVGVIVINGIFSFWQEYKAEQAVAALRQLLPQKVEALRDGVVVELLASELVPGDVVLLEEGKMDWSGDVTQLKAEHKREIEALQAENERLKVERENDAFRLVWAMNWMRMSVHDHGFTKHVLERGGMGDYSDCATYVDKCAGATQEAAP